MSHDHGHSAAGKNKRQLTIVFWLTATYMIAEIVGGLIANSLALLADAGHMFTDVAGIGLALVAIRFAEKPATSERTYGFYRVEILAALTNAVVLIGVSLYILYEAYQRFKHPPEVSSGMMLAVASVGLAVNLAGMFLLRKGSEESLNMKGAYFEVLSDMLTSVGVIVAALIMITTEWNYADPLISAGIGLFIFPRTWNLLREAVGILLEGTPSELNIAALRESMEAISGVAGVHDLHAWSLTSGVNALSAHVVLADECEHDPVLKEVLLVLKEKFHIDHATIQIEVRQCDSARMHL